jgi:hypothetical protein
MTDCEDIILPTYLILSSNQTASTFFRNFATKPEFDLVSYNAPSGENSNLFFQSIRDCIIHGSENDEDFIIICLPNNCFTKNYNKNVLIAQIIEANRRGCDILIGGLIGFTNAIPISPKLFWIDKFSEATFLVIYRKFFKKLLEFNVTTQAEIASLSSNKLVIVPFITISNSLQGDDSSSTTCSSDIQIQTLKRFENEENRLFKIQYIQNKFSILHEPDKLH